MRRFVVLALLAACNFQGSGESFSSPDATSAPEIDGNETSAHPLVINEVAAGSDPDWFEIVNRTSEPIDLTGFVFTDVENDFDRAATFDRDTLSPFAYYAQNVDDESAGFKLGDDESLWIYRASDHALIDTITWKRGDSPHGFSYRRMPDATGLFSKGFASKGFINF